VYQNILLAVALQQWDEFTPHALAAREAAVALARGAGAKLSVLSVYEYGKIQEPGLSQEMSARYRESYMQQVDAAMEMKMKTLLAGVQGMDIPMTPLLKMGEPRGTIIDTAQRMGADLLVIGAHNKRSVFDVMLGGTAAYVSRHAPCPVIMIKPVVKQPTPESA